MNDLQKTIHYTRNNYIIFGNLLSFIPENAKLIEPFVGEGDLLELFPLYHWETYDIQPLKGQKQQDTLLNPPNYLGKWVITNPPYLAKNKATDKTIFNKYNTDDLYKASLLSLLDCEGGLIVIPTNFFTDERTGDVRKKFLNRFQILKLNIFTKPVFETTTYSVCSFAFQKKEKKEENQIIPTIIEDKKHTFSLKPIFNYRLGGDFFSKLDNVENIFGRLVGNTSKDFITNMKLYALDTRSTRIRLEYETEPYIGKNSDRTYATLTCKKELSEEQQKKLIKKFNDTLEDFRKQYCDVCMTNYRDYNRKRIGFTFAYKLLSYLLNTI